MMNRLHTLSYLLFLTLILASAAPAQEASGLLSRREAVKLYQQIGDHMEATSIGAPELARAGAPLIENVRQATDALQVGATREHTGLIYKLTRNALCCG